MLPPQNTKLNKLSIPLNTSWHNRSMSSISATSDTATFHSAHAHLSNLELRPLSQLSHTQTETHIQPSPTSTPKPLISPKLEAIKMSRQDSGYSESQTPLSPTSSRRASIASGSASSTRRPRSPSKTKRRTTAGSSHSSSRRPSTKRNSRSSANIGIRTSTSSSRPGMQKRYTVPYTSHLHTNSDPIQNSSSSSNQQYQFFHFPTFPTPSCPLTSSSDNTPAPISPPPATVQYWTSDSTRRLEYAAIDAASKGVKGFFIRCLPDCILPKGSKRMKFHCEDGGGSDCGSVRRYRLALPAEEKSCGSGVRECVSEGRKGLLRRWTFGSSKK